MKRNNLKILAACLAILITFFSFGCARQTMTGTMDKSVEPAMQGAMKAQQVEAMKNDMDTMKEQNMDEPVEEMKNDTVKDDMGGTKGTMMVPEKDTMMK